MIFIKDKTLFALRIFVIICMICLMWIYKETLYYFTKDGAYISNNNWIKANAYTATYVGLAAHIGLLLVIITSFIYIKDKKIYRYSRQKNI